MKLVTYDTVRKFMGFDSGVQQDVIESAIHTATEQLAALLQTEVVSGSYTDDFYVLRSQCLEQAGGQFRTRLNLSSGLVTALTVVTYAATYADLQAGDTTTVDTPEPVLKSEKGEVLILGYDLRDMYVRASYTAGFAADTTDTQLLTGVPPWLEEAAIMQTVCILDQANPTLRHEKADQAERAVKELSDARDTIIASHVRYFPSGCRPLA